MATIPDGSPDSARALISILSGCLTLYAFGMKTGGPAVMIWGWGDQSTATHHRKRRGNFCKATRQPQARC